MREGEKEKRERDMARLHIVLSLFLITIMSFHESCFITQLAA